MFTIYLFNVLFATKRTAILNWVKIFKRRQAYVTPKYIGHFWEKFNRNRISSFCVIEPQTKKNGYHLIITTIKVK